jgi:hypothetical protein
VLPSVVARDLDEDPEQLSLVCFPLLQYAEAHSVYRRANASELKAWGGSRLMDQVTENDFALRAREIEGDE